MVMYLCGGGSKQSWVKLADFDYTKSLTDSIRAITGSNSGCTRNENGIYFPSANALITYSAFASIWRVPQTAIELDIGNGSIINNSNNNRLIMWQSLNGLVWRGSGTKGWAVYNGSWSNAISNDTNFFNNSTIRIEILTGSKVAIYKNNTKLGEFGMGNIGDYTLGSSQTSCYGIYIKAMRLYIKNI